MSRNFQNWYFEGRGFEKYGDNIEAAAENFGDEILAEADDLLDQQDN